MFKSQTTPAWFRYSVPSTPTERHNCYNSGPVVHLEPSKELIVFIRVENGQVGKVRSFGGNCQIDSDGVPVIELTGVTPAASIALLDSLLPSHKSAFAAISLHADPAAEAYLLKTAKSGPTADARGQALFWLANRAGRLAAPAIRGAIEDDPEVKVKERAVFALSQLPRDEGIPLLIDVAKNNRSPQVRRKAMFWLGQSKDPRALKFFEELLAR
jgi:HEAT repeat protein